MTDQLGTILTGAAPPPRLVQDIRTTIRTSNVLVTPTQPEILLKRPKYRTAKARLFELGNKYRRLSRADRGTPGER